MRMPASAGPIRPAAENPPSSRLFAWAIVVTSSPTKPGRITRWEAAYGGMNAPIAATIPSSTPNDSRPAEYSSGSAMISGARAKSAMSIVLREPSFWTRVPLGMPRIAIGRIWTARTTLIFAAEPVVTSTNHGSARYPVIRQPSVEISSAGPAPPRPPVHVRHVTNK